MKSEIWPYLTDLDSWCPWCRPERGYKCPVCKRFDDDKEGVMSRDYIRAAMKRQRKAWDAGYEPFTEEQLEQLESWIKTNATRQNLKSLKRQRGPKTAFSVKITEG